MRLLFVTQHLPYPPVSGARRREYELIKRLSKWIDVVVVAISKVYEEDAQYVSALETIVKKVYLYQANSQLSLRSANEMNISLQVNRNYSKALLSDISNIVQNERIDIIHIEGFFMYYSIESLNIDVPIVLCEQNIEYDIWSQQISYQNQTLSCVYKRQAEIVQLYERHAWLMVDAIVSVTEDDANVINSYLKHNKCKVVTNGYDHFPNLFDTCMPVPTNKHDFNILYVGNFDYFPNEDAASFLVIDVLPLIKNQISDIKLYLVGNIGGSGVESLASETVVVTGRVDNLASYYINADVVVCPLRFGGGIKTKVLEALQYDKVIVISPIGLQGIHVSDESPFIVASEKSEFASVLINLYNHPEMIEDKSSKCRIMRKAWTTWDDSALQLYYIYNNILEQ